MAKKKQNKQVDEIEVINKPEIKPDNTGFVEIELIVNVSGMKIGDIKKLPKSLANQMVNSNKAKFKN